jgi:hypothetical protein
MVECRTYPAKKAQKYPTSDPVAGGMEGGYLRTVTR